MENIIDYNEEYNRYAFNCYCNGDIWAEYFRPYTFDEWIDAGCPNNPGKNDKFCVKIVKQYAEF